MKIYTATEISTQTDQDIKIQPAPGYDGIEIYFKESDDEKFKGEGLFLDEDTLKLFIKKIQEMMNYVNE